MSTRPDRLQGQARALSSAPAELFISRKAVECHLGNIYVKCDLKGQQELRRLVEQRRCYRLRI